ncbi:MAG: hypothetical protein BWK76_05420 [Desulfobulbaceae bacterium A2]|nr:MAG: hypothetical protein BWK76_05420 [Desulfobulbaceae bacterium A2]
MTLLALAGSPRRNGNSETLLMQVLEQLAAQGQAGQVIRLNELAIRPCQGCGGCDKTGHCVIDDDMQDIYRAIDAADQLLLVSPIYFYGLTAQAKAAVDRSQALWSRRYALRQPPPHPRGNDRLAYLLSIGATRGEKLFDGALLTAKYAFDAMGFSWGGALLLRQLDERGAAAHSPEALEQAAALGRCIAASSPFPLPQKTTTAKTTP